MTPTVAEIVDLVVRLEDDPGRRHILDGQPYALFSAAVDEGLIRADAIDQFAEIVGRAVKQGVLGYQAEHGGVHLPPPEALWTNHAFQSRIGYHATVDGHQMAALYRQRHGRATPPAQPEPVTSIMEVDDDGRDIFICHASEDKETVARPLRDALVARGWSVWLDELELTVGDSLTGHIEAALARSRFGVAILSPASFEKQWPQRELAGLAAREVDADTKVILPVWHEVDHSFIVARAPILADRLGAMTSAGLEDVANKLSIALERAGMTALSGLPPASVVQSVETRDDEARLSIPTTRREQEALVAARGDFWEYRLFAGSLVRERNELETKWDDHRLRLPRGSRRDVDQATAVEFIQREFTWMRKQVGVLDRILDRGIQEEAFGTRGQPGDPVRIEAMARRIMMMYESLMDWAAALRATSIPEQFEELVEATACFTDASVTAIRDFINAAADQVSRLPELSAAGTEEHPARVSLNLTLAVDPAVATRHEAALEKLSAELRHA